MKYNYINFQPKIFRIFIFSIIFLVIFFNGELKIYGSQYRSGVIAIYKTSDGYSETNNPIKWHFEQDFLKYGFTIKYHDLDDGIPAKSLLDNSRAILTWFNSGIIPKKEKALEYINFLDKAVDRGVKLIIVNSFGAYGYKEDGVDKWDLINNINPIFIKMGFFFKGFWTGNPADLKIVQIDRDMSEKNGKQDVNISRHYQMIVPMRGDVETYLTVKRTDQVKGIGDGESSVILTSRNGGFALEQYVFHSNKMMLNPAQFLKKSLFYNDGTLDAGIIIGDIDNREHNEKNIQFALKYAKIKNTLIDLDILKNMSADDILSFEVLIIATKSVDKIPAALIKKYVEMGGRVIFARYANLTQEFMELLGLKYYGKNTEFFKEGFLIKSSFFLNNFPISGQNVDLNIKEAKLINSQVIATANDEDKKDKYPLLWERTIGKGKILYWNTDLLIDTKRLRGTLIQSIHYLSDIFVSSMVNVGMMMIDDFPAPLWNIHYKDYRQKYYSGELDKESDNERKKRLNQILERLKKYPDVSDTEFIRNVWMKDILSFQSRLGFKYSSFLIFNYSNDTGTKGSIDEFQVKDFFLAEGGLPIKMGFFALNNGWDLGFHGYNHQSMTVTRPKEYASEPWAGREAMVKALTVARKEWEKIYARYTMPFVYVPPHNIIDENGLSALGEVFPSIHVIASVYIGKQGESEQEFEFTSNLRFFQMPRLTSGYYMNDSEKYILYDAIHNFGLVSHFIHPDDVFDESRSKGFHGWEFMKTQFVNDFSTVNKFFPWLRWMTVKDAFEEFLFYNNTNIRVKNEGNKIIVESSDGSDKYLYFRLSLKKGQNIIKSQNCSQIFANSRTGDYVYKTNEPRSEITIR